MDRFNTNPQSLEHLLGSIDAGKLALPDFQRDFVWLPGATEGLLKSLARSFPAGSLLFFPYKPDTFAPRSIANAPALNGATPLELILDGQQRLTSLYQAMYGVGDHRYFVDLAALMADDEIEEAIFYRHKNRAGRYSGLDQQAELLVMPLSILFGGDGFHEWRDSVLERRPEPEDARRELGQRLNEVHKRWIRPIEQYDFPVVSLAHDTTLEAVCSIFETLNSTGVTLTVFELLAARYYAQGLDLRRRWEHAKSDAPIIAEFDVNPYYVLQAIALQSANSVKRGDVLKLTIHHIEAHWDTVIRGFRSALEMLREDCGVRTAKWLPYGYQLVPLASVWDDAVQVLGPESGANRELLIRWFWCTSFSQWYDSAASTRAARDFAELRAWFGGGDAPEVIRNFSFDPEQLRSITPRQQSVYKGLMALVLRHGARDFHHATPLSAEAIRAKDVDDHHVFPRAYLNPSDAPPRYPEELVNCILNRTMIDADTNRRIGKRPPSQYMAEIAEHLAALEDPEAFDRLLRSHLLPAGSASPLLSDDFDRFLQEREDLIAQEIAKATNTQPSEPTPAG